MDPTVSSEVGERRASQSSTRSRAGSGRLLEACRRPGCPVCECLRELGRRHLAAVLAEHVTDPLTRERLAASRGFCATHAAALVEIPEAALGTAIVYHSLVERVDRWLHDEARERATSGRGSRWRALVRRSRRTNGRRRARCPVCAELLAVEDRQLDALLAGLGDSELGAAYAASDGLCLPHLERALARGGHHPAAGRLIALARDTLRALAGDLQRFVDKHDHRLRPDFTEREATAWRRALAKLAGRSELFGPEMEREGGGPRRRVRRRP